MTTKRTPKRGRRPLPENERKDRLVQTRVPETLDETLRKQAKKSRVSVSQLIRNVLEDTFDLVDDVVAEATNLGRTVKRDARRIADTAKGRTLKEQHAALEQVYAWQEVVLNRDVDCARCGRSLRSGKKALYGLQEDPSAPRLWLCAPCGAAL
jgi:hypothetical protein